MQGVIEFGVKICVRNGGKDFLFVKACERERFYIRNWVKDDVVRFRSKVEVFGGFDGVNV